VRAIDFCFSTNIGAPAAIRTDFQLYKHWFKIPAQERRICCDPHITFVLFLAWIFASSYAPSGGRRSE
jgi:hypothetical protein